MSGIQKVTKFSIKTIKLRLEIKKEKEGIFQNLKNFYTNLMSNSSYKDYKKKIELLDKI